MTVGEILETKIPKLLQDLDHHDPECFHINLSDKVQCFQIKELGDSDIALFGNIGVRARSDAESQVSERCHSDEGQESINCPTIGKKI